VDYGELEGLAGIRKSKSLREQSKRPSGLDLFPRCDDLLIFDTSIPFTRFSKIQDRRKPAPAMSQDWGSSSNVGKQKSPLQKTS